MPATVVGAAETAYARHAGATVDTRAVLGEAASLALADAGISASDVDGLAVASFSLAPDHAIDLAWRLGLRLRWLLEDTNGGASGLDMLAQASTALAAGDASTILILAGDAQGAAAVAERQAAFNAATRDHLAPLHYGGPNSLFAMLTQRQMAATGLEHEDYGRVVIAQRRWAADNPGAVYREPLTMAQYLAAPLVAEPLRRYDCVPGVAGADAIVLRAEGGAVHVRATGRSFNHDDQSGDGLQTGLRQIAPALYEQAAVAPSDLDLACLYDDYPAIVLAQLADAGIAPDDDIAGYVRSTLAERRFALNTSGGMLSCGQAGAAGGLHGLVEAVRQLRGEGGARQVAGARLALVSGYGMLLYRYGAASAAAILERR